LDRGRPKAYDGTLNIWLPQGWLVLKNARGDPIFGRFLGSSECIFAGLKVLFLDHTATIGLCLISDNNVQTVGSQSPVFQFSNNLATANSPVLLSSNDSEEGSQSAVYTALQLNLDFSSGLAFRKEVKWRFGATMHPIGKSDHFLMAVSFGRSKFKLTPDSVSLALESLHWCSL
jgi:hypothetical protein